MPDRPQRVEPRVCVNCVMDTSDPGIRFDADGVCNHCRMYQDMAALASQPADAAAALERVVERIKHDGRNQPYDCLIGLSGGVDSSYLAYQARQLGLRPLAIHFDNGWNSERAVRNIELVLRGLDLDLFTYVVDWEEFRDLQVSFFKASVIDIEMLTDHAIAAVSLQVARQRGIRYILSGTNMRTEAILPRAWVHSKLDFRNIRAIHARYGRGPIRSFPATSTIRQRLVRRWDRIAIVSMLDMLPYDKAVATRSLQRAFGWQDHSGKHHESIFTRFYQGYILPTKFGVDKRRAHLSTLVCSGQMTREQAQLELAQDTYDLDVLTEDKAYVLKKLAMSEEEFAAYIASPPQPHEAYASEEQYLRLFRQVRAAARRVQSASERVSTEAPSGGRAPMTDRRDAEAPRPPPEVAGLVTRLPGGTTGMWADGPGMRIALMGTRGIPARYGGFETFYENLAPRLVERGHDVTVYTRPWSVGRMRSYRGVQLTPMPSIHTKHLDTISHTAFSVLHGMTQRYDVVLICGPGNAPLAWVPRLTGAFVALNVDGADSKRAKWGRLATRYLRTAERLSATLANVIVADNRAVQERFRDDYGADAVFIPYGANIGRTEERAALDRLGLESRRYVLWVGRLEPETRVEELIAAFAELGEPGLKLVVVGDAPFADGYKARLRDMAGPEVIFAGYAFGQDYVQLSSHAFVYVQTSPTSGTSPALLDQMGIGNAVIGRGTPTTCEVIADAGLTFDPDDAIAGMVRVLRRLIDNPALVGRLRAAGPERIRSAYSWEAVTDAYEDLFRRHTHQ